MPKYPSSINRLLITPYSRDTCSSIIQLIPDILRIAKWTYTKENIQWARDAEYPYLSCFVFAHIVYVTKVFLKDAMWLSILRFLLNELLSCVSTSKVLKTKMFKGVSKHVRMRNDNMLLNLPYKNVSSWETILSSPYMS